MDDHAIRVMHDEAREELKVRHAEWSLRTVAEHGDQDEAIAAGVRELATQGMGPLHRKVQALTGTPIRTRLMGVWRAVVEGDWTEAVAASAVG